MENPHLYFFGCSFTSMETSLTGHMFNNFRNIISEKLTCSSLNYAISGNSNEQIIDDIYNSNISNRDEGTIFIIQFSFNDRLGMYFDLQNRFESMCKRENPDNPIDKIKIDFYNDWLKYFYSKQTRIKEFKKQVDFVCTWLKSKNIKFICFGMDEDIDSRYFEPSFYERNNFIKFDNTYSLYGHMCLNKLRISDDSKYCLLGEPRDWHLNNEGHNYLANKILENLSNNQWAT
jgi:hypothetical protein